MNEFSNTSTPVARRDYKCIYCFELIAAGEKHVKHTGYHDGDFQSFRMHNECWEDHNEMSDDGMIYPGEARRPKKSESK